MRRLVALFLGLALLLPLSVGAQVTFPLGTGADLIGRPSPCALGQVPVRDGSGNWACGAGGSSLGPNLTAIDGLTTSANQMTLWTGAGTAAQIPVSVFAQSILDDAGAQSVRATLAVPGLTTTNTFTGINVWNFISTFASGSATVFNGALIADDATITQPNRAGTILPGSCTDAETFVLRSAPASDQFHICSGGVFAKQGSGGAPLAADGEVDAAKAVNAADPRIAATALTPGVYDALVSLPTTGFADLMPAKKFFACNPANTPNCDALRVHDMPNGSDANAPTCSAVAPCETVAEAYVQCPPNGSVACVFGAGDVFAFAAMVDQPIPSAACTDLSIPCIAWVASVPGSEFYLQPNAPTGVGVLHVTADESGSTGAGSRPNALVVLEGVVMRAGNTRPLVIGDDGVTVVALRSGCESDPADAVVPVDCMRVSQDSRGVSISARITADDQSCWLAERGAKWTILGGRCEQQGNAAGNYAALGGVQLTALPLESPNGTPIAVGDPSATLVGSVILGTAPSATTRGHGAVVSHISAATFDTGLPKVVMIDTSITGYVGSGVNTGCILFAQAESNAPNAVIKFLGSRCGNASSGIAFTSSVFAEPTSGHVVDMRGSVFDLGAGDRAILLQGSLGGTLGWIAAGTRWIGLQSVLRDDATFPMFRLRLAGVSGEQAYANVAAMRAGIGTASAAVQTASAQLFADGGLPHGTIESTVAQLAGPSASCDAAQACAGMQPAFYVEPLESPVPHLPALGNATITEIRWPARD